MDEPRDWWCVILNCLCTHRTVKNLRDPSPSFADAKAVQDDRKVTLRFKIFPRLFAAFLILTVSLPIPEIFSAPVSSATGKKAMVATAHPMATRAALQVLRDGGNAADAAITAQWVLNVVEPQSSGIGGGSFFLYYEAKTKGVFFLDGRESAPKDATPEMFRDEKGVIYPFMPERVTGGLPVGVPGTLRLLKRVHERFTAGRHAFEALFEPAIEIADKGFPVYPRLARMIDLQKKRLRLFPDAKKFFLDKQGQPLQPGTILKQPDLAGTFRLIQAKGVGTFYEGALADEIVRAVRFAPFHPGRLTHQDLFYYAVKEREAVYGNYRGYDVLSSGPPSSGGTTLIEALHILENYDLKSMGRGIQFMHYFSEAQKLAFQDRNQYLGDPDFVKVPLAYLLSKQLGKDLSAKIQAQAILPVKTPAPPAPAAHTTHISIVDEFGNIACFTSTIEHIFGSALMVPGRGFFLNNELTDFDPEPLPGNSAPANRPGPDKRPRSSMTPTLVFKDGKPVFVLGSPGGSTIIATVLNILVNLVDYGMSAENALRAPKVMNRDGATELETALFNDKDVQSGLVARGHTVIKNAYYGNAQIITIHPETGELHGASDPRGEGKAEGY